MKIVCEKIVIVLWSTIIEILKAAFQSPCYMPDFNILYIRIVASVLYKLYSRFAHYRPPRFPALPGWPIYDKIDRIFNWVSSYISSLITMWNQTCVLYYSLKLKLLLRNHHQKYFNVYKITKIYLLKIFSNFFWKNQPFLTLFEYLKHKLCEN